MRYATTIILLIGMLGNTFSSYFVWLDYALNKKFIAANLCVNKDRPELKCEGRCYLCKKINKETNKEPQNSGHRAGFKFQLLSEMQTGSYLFCIAESHTARQPAYQEPPCSIFRPSFFHPPQAA